MKKLSSTLKRTVIYLGIIVGLHSFAPNAFCATTIFSESFALGWPNTWSIGNEGSVTNYRWWINSYRANGGSSSGFCAGTNSTAHSYPNDLNTYMQKTNVSLAGYGGATLAFAYWAQTQTNNDYLAVSVRDQSNAWHELWRTSGDSGGWVTQSVDCSEFAGQSNLYVQFKFASDSSITNEGIWLDDIILTAEPAGSLQFNATSYNVYENSNNVFLTVTRSGGSGGAASISYTTSNSTAQAGSDYTGASGTLSWTNGESAEKTITVSLIDDQTYEDTETFKVYLSNASGASLGSPSSATVTIYDNEVAPGAGSIQLSASTYPVNEDASSASISVTRTDGSLGLVSVAYATANGTAQAGSDYTVSSGTLLWADGETNSKTILIPIVDDSSVESNETFTISLSFVSGGASLGSPSSATIIIADNDSAGTVQFSPSTYSVAEDGESVSLIVIRSGGSSGTASVKYDTVAGTAQSGADFTSTSGTLTWTNGDDSSQTILAPILLDASVEGNETFRVDLSNASGASQGSPSSASITIIDSGSSTSVLSAPKEVFASDGEFTSKIKITWWGLAGATSYEVWRNTVNDSSSAVRLAVIPDQGYYDVTATPWITNYYWVTARNASGRGAFSDPDTGWCKSAASLPATPVNIVATDGETGEIKINWADASEAASYEVWRNISNDIATAVKVVHEWSGNLVSDDEVLPDVTNFYWVVAKNNLGSSGFSDSDSGWCRPTTLQTPTNVLASKGTCSAQVKVTWNTVPEATYYEIWRNENMNKYSATNMGTSSATTVYFDQPVTLGLEYYYWVLAKSERGVSDFSSSDRGWAGVVWGDYDRDGKKDLVLYQRSTTVWKLFLLRDSNEVTLSWGIPEGQQNAVQYNVKQGFVYPPPDPPPLPPPDEPEDPSEPEETDSGSLPPAPRPPYDPGSQPLLGDFDGDLSSDIVTYHEASGYWGFVLSSYGFSNAIVRSFGGSGWAPVVGDYDGDGKADPTIYHESSGTWSAMLSDNDYSIATGIFGGAGHTPVAGDYDGDGKTDPAVYEESSGTWRVMLSGNDYSIAIAAGILGGSGYTPVMGDYDGDGKADLAVYQESSGTWNVMLSDNNYSIAAVMLGGPGYTPVVGDYDGDGRADLVVYQESSGTWKVMLSGSTYVPFDVKFGGAGYSAVR